MANQTFDSNLNPGSENSGAMWNSLTEEQKDEILKSFEESENEENLIESEYLFKDKNENPID